MTFIKLKHLDDPITGVSKLDDLYLISIFQKATLEARNYQTFKTDATGEEGWDGTDAAYNDLMNNNIMPGSGRASQSQVQGNHTSFVKEKTNQFDAARFRESEMLYRLPSTGSF